MTEKDTLKDSKVTLEDLLRFKRNEKPSPEFWEDWDRSLEQKRWQALRGASASLKAGPIWATLSTCVKFGVPAAAAAALTLMVYVGSQSAYTQNAESPATPVLAHHTSTHAPAPGDTATTELTESRDYVIDTLSVAESATPAGFTRVMEAEMFRKDAPSGAIFVADSMSTHTASASGASYNYF